MAPTAEGTLNVSHDVEDPHAVTPPHLTHPYVVDHHHHHRQLSRWQVFMGKLRTEDTTFNAMGAQSVFHLGDLFRAIRLCNMVHRKGANEQSWTEVRHQIGNCLLPEGAMPVRSLLLISTRSLRLRPHSKLKGHKPSVKVNFDDRTALL